MFPLTGNPEDESMYLPCNACEDESEHYVNVWDEWECVTCGDVLNEDTL